MFSREIGRPKTAKLKIYFNSEGVQGFRCGSLFGAVVVSTGCRRCAFALSLGVFRPFVPLRFCFPAIPAKYALFRVLRRFYGVSRVPCGFAWLGRFALIVGRFLCVCG